MHFCQINPFSVAPNTRKYRKHFSKEIICRKKKKSECHCQIPSYQRKVESANELLIAYFPDLLWLWARPSTMPHLSMHHWISDKALLDGIWCCQKFHCYWQQLSDAGSLHVVFLMSLLVGITECCTIFLAELVRASGSLHVVFVFLMSSCAVYISHFSLIRMEDLLMLIITSCCWVVQSVCVGLFSLHNMECNICRITSCLLALIDSSTLFVIWVISNWQVVINAIYFGFWFW